MVNERWMTGHARETTSHSRSQQWTTARKRHGLSHVHVQMARELGMNPRKLGKLDNHDQEPWKLPLPAFIQSLYQKRFGKDHPDVVYSIEERGGPKGGTSAIGALGRGVRADLLQRFRNTSRVSRPATVEKSRTVGALLDEAERRAHQAAKRVGKRDR
jgi:hypothetical protein